MCFCIVLFSKFVKMKKQLFVSFLARKTLIKKSGLVPIYCRVRYDKTNCTFNTHIDVSTCNWDSDRTRVIGKNKKSLNFKLDQIRFDLINKYNQLNKTNEIITAKTIVDLYKNKMTVLNSIVSVFKKHNKDMQSLLGIQYAYGSFKNYKTTLKHLVDYIKQKYSTSDILLTKLNYDFIYNFSQFILKNTHCTHNGMMKHIQRFKKITNYCIKNNYINRDPFFGYKISFKKTTPIFLNKQELYILKNIELNKNLNRVRDVFLFACYTGLSYIDLYNLTSNNIGEGNDNYKWIYIKRHKTNIPSSIPLLPPAHAILEKYENPENEKIFPMITNQKTNQALKKILKLCEINKNITFHCETYFWYHYNIG